MPAAPSLALSWPIEALRTELALHASAARDGVWVDVRPALDSTNTELMRRARAGHIAPTLLVAEVQTAGRGRLGRAWHGSAAGSALTFSLGLALAPREFSGLSLAVGLSLAESLHAELRIKWPNDLWWQGRKLAGILVETTAAPGLPADARHVVIGVGLNIDAPAADSLNTPPAWVREFAPTLDAPALLCRVAPVLLATVRAFEAHGFAPLQARFAARDALAGQPVRLSDGTEGLALGVDTQGALRVQTASGTLEVNSAEVSVRPVVQAVPADTQKKAPT